MGINIIATQPSRDLLVNISVLELSLGEYHVVARWRACAAVHCPGIGTVYTDADSTILQGDPKCSPRSPECPALRARELMRSWMQRDWYPLAKDAIEVESERGLRRSAERWPVAPIR